MGAPRGTFTSIAPPVVNLVRNRPWAVDAVWQNPPGTPATIVGWTITAELVFDGATLAPTVTLTNPIGGGFELSLTADQTIGVPFDGLPILGITMTDPLGNTRDFGISVNVQTPIDP